MPVLMAAGAWGKGKAKGFVSVALYSNVGVRGGCHWSHLQHISAASQVLCDGTDLHQKSISEQV